MKISHDTIRHVANLARLAIHDDEVPQLSAELSDIIGYAELLQKIALVDVAPTSHPFAQANVLRADEPTAGLTRQAALANAADHDEEHIRVPAVLEGGGA